MDLAKTQGIKSTNENHTYFCAITEQLEIKIKYHLQEYFELFLKIPSLYNKIHKILLREMKEGLK